MTGRGGATLSIAFKVVRQRPISGTRPGLCHPRMSARLPLSVALAGLFALTACDSAVTVDGQDLDDTDRVTGVWLGTSHFVADTVIADYNYRVKADYVVDFRFDVLHDDGLAWGTVTATFDGTLIAREAGRPADTLAMNGSQTLVSDVFGTYIRPEMELDVPFGPYTEDLWTFDKVASRMDLHGLIEHTWRFPRFNVAQPDTFDYVLPMIDAPMTIARQGNETPNVPGASVTPVSGAPLLRLDGANHHAILSAMGTRVPGAGVRTRAAR